MDEKQCTVCREVKPLNEYYLDKGRPRANCKECHRQAHYERRAANPERAREIDAKHYAKHREKKRAQQSEWWAKNGAARNKRVQEKHAANPEHKRAQWRAWREAHPDVVIERNAFYRSRYKTPTGEAFTRDDVWQRDQGICGICREPVEGAYSIDHILPVSLGGENYFHNVQVAHPACNSAKQARVGQLHFGL